MSRRCVLSSLSIIVSAGLAASVTNCGGVEREPVAQAYAPSTSTLNAQCALVGPPACAGQGAPPVQGIMFCCLPHYVATTQGTCSASYELSSTSQNDVSGCVASGPDACTTTMPTFGTALFDFSTNPDTNDLGPRTIHVDCDNSSPKSCKETITVLDCEAPALQCPASATVLCGTTDVRSLVDASDNCHLADLSCSAVPAGGGAVNCTATDGSGNTSSCTFDVTTSGGPPQIQPKSTLPIVLWPPNHKYQTIDPLQDCVAGISDACGNTVTGATVAIQRVTSDEVEDAPSKGATDANGDGHTCNDIVIADDGKTVDVRAERDGKGDGRVYTIDFTVTTTGGSTAETCRVIVPHDQSPPITAVDSGCLLCAGTGCGSCPMHDMNCDY